VWVCLTVLAVLLVAELLWSNRGTARPRAPASLDAQIALLTVAPADPPTGYDPSRFPHWEDVDGNGCDARCEVLARQRRHDLPGLASGGWLSAYDGYTTDDPAELDIDHVVPLGEAWVSGAARWDPARREAFANDLVSPELLAVTAATNRSKGDRDPASWQPPNDADWCAYASSWVAVKLAWQLSADPAEVAALRNMAGACS
jgi:hypothetical protein